MYDLIFDDKVIDYIEKLDMKYRKQILTKLISTKNQPYQFFKKLSYREGYKLRIGSYRAIADIDEKKKQIIIIRIGHRKNIYEKYWGLL
jgi:mRNA interferase RelE/StbE